LGPLSTTFRSRMHFDSSSLKSDQTQWNSGSDSTVGLFDEAVRLPSGRRMIMPTRPSSLLSSQIPSRTDLTPSFAAGPAYVAAIAPNGKRTTANSPGISRNITGTPIPDRGATRGEPTGRANVFGAFRIGNSVRPATALCPQAQTRGPVPAAPSSQIRRAWPSPRSTAGAPATSACSTPAANFSFLSFF
jgi:hypothetical protein